MQAVDTDPGFGGVFPFDREVWHGNAVEELGYDAFVATSNAQRGDVSGGASNGELAPTICYYPVSIIPQEWCVTPFESNVIKVASQDSEESTTCQETHDPIRS